MHNIEKGDSNGDDGSHLSLPSSPSSPSSSSPSTTTDSEESIMKEIQCKTSNIIHEKALAMMGSIESCLDSDSAEHHHDKVYDSFRKGTEGMMSTWSEYFSNVEKIEKAQSERSSGDGGDTMFRNVYMEMMTEAFADELDDLRQGRVEGIEKKKKTDDDVLRQHNVIIPVAIGGQALNDDDVKVLVSCLDSGMEMWTEEEKQFLVEEKKLKHSNHPPNLEMNLSLHERRRRALFGQRD